MRVDHNGMLWVATRGGVHRLDPRTRQVATWRHDPSDPDSLADNVARPLLEDRKGRLWIGTFDGLDMFDRKSGKFRHYRHDARDPASLSHDEVHFLLEDSKGTLWVGTMHGLNRMSVDGARSKARFKRYTVRDGLADDGVSAMLEDARQPVDQHQYGPVAPGPDQQPLAQLQRGRRHRGRRLFRRLGLADGRRQHVLRRLQRHHRVPSGGDQRQHDRAARRDHRL
ncbi:hypothetical protein LP419_07715 [Massilia sp. H-1]|nr:hypothetical protein LP419_07715 [Massilia sp. H-1]